MTGLGQRTWLWGLMLVGAVGCQHTHYPNSLAAHDSSVWEKDIASFEKTDRIAPPPPGAIVFTGSSSIRLWKTLELDFPEHLVLNRGFGGCQLADVAHYADRIITPYRPSQVVIYAGGNDINAGKSPEIVFGDFVALVRKIRSHSPKTRISYISIAPNPARWAQVHKVRKANALIADYCRRHRIDFVDVFPRMLGSDGRPRPELFVSDRLHMNATGYALWREAVRPFLAAQ
ncbi:MAG: SGNH/GDSL hydrolase family protein [Verrucomicrobiota bacterium]|nr:SGNH/GDSL hydrolase family protein [Verrucomicrobiota bacterium]